MSEVYFGQENQRQGSGFNSMAFVINQLINKLSTATLVQVVAVSNTDEVAAVGTVDVVPMVGMVNGIGEVTEHGTIYNVPYFRIQGGTNAIIIDPKAGDIGLAVFCSRDISSVKKTKKRAPPASNRKYNMADGLYVGGFLNQAPETYIQFTDSGIEIKGNVTVTGTVTATTDVQVGTVSLKNHVHGGVTSGAAQTSIPI
jgi:hypothetical protein